MKAVAIVSQVFLSLACAVASYATQAEAAKSYVEKKLADQVIHVPIVDGFSPACEESAEFANRVVRVAPSTHVYLTCSIESQKWTALKAGKPQMNLYPMIVVTVQRHQAGGPFSRAEFGQLEDYARARLPKSLAIDKKAPADPNRKGITENGTIQSPENYEQGLQGFFDVKSKAPSFSFITNRSYTIPNGTKNVEYRELNVILTVYQRGEVLQIMIIDTADANANAARLRSLTQRWLDAYNALNEL